MGENAILFPYCTYYDNRHRFAFTVEMARKTNACVITLSFYDITHKDLLTEEAYRKAKEKDKNKTYCHLLELRGYYQGQFNKWQSFNNIKFKNIISAGNPEFVLLTLLKKENILFIISDQCGHNENILLNEFTLMLFCKYESKCIILPEDKEFYAVDPNLPSHEFIKHKEYIFKLMLARSVLLNFPADSARLKNELAVIN